MRRA
jgi:ATP-dependent Lhr-like helicase